MVQANTTPFFQPNANRPITTVLTRPLIGSIPNRPDGVRSLAQDFTNTSSTVFLSTDISTLPDYVVLTVGGERVLAGPKNVIGMSFPVITRQFDASPAGTGAVGDPVYFNITAYPINQIGEEVFAIEARLKAASRAFGNLEYGLLLGGM